MMLIVGIGLTVSCSKDDSTPKVIDNPTYGMQISGTATGGEAYVIDALQMVEPTSDFNTKELRDGMYYGIYYLSAGDFSFKEVTLDGEVTYGMSDVAETTQSDQAGNPFTFSRGTLVSGGTGTFSVTTEGLYYIITDATSATFWVMKINSIEISATNDEATMTSGSTAGAVFELSGTDLRGAYKVRLNTAWKIIADDIPYGGADFPNDGIRPDISFGGSLDNLTFDGSDIAFTPIPLHLTDFTFTWDPSKKGIAGLTGATTDAGERQPTDYSSYLLGLIGNGVMNADTSWGWGDVSYENQLPTKNGYIYTWTWSGVSIADTTGGRTWKFRKDNAWSFTLGYTSVSMSGTAGYYFFSGSDDGNFGTDSANVYDMKLQVDATSDKWTLFVAEPGGYLYDVYSLIGNAFNNDGGTPADWDYDLNFTYDSNSGDLYTYSLNNVTMLSNGEFKIRKNHDWTTSFGYSDLTIQGDAANFTDNSGNIKVTAGKTYNIVFTYDASTSAAHTISFTQVK